MKLGQIANSKNALTTLLKCSLPIGIAWELKKFAKITNDAVVSFEEIRNQKIMEMGVEDENKKGVYSVKPENMGIYQKEMNELLDKDIDAVVPQIKIADLLSYRDANGKQIEIDAEQLLSLDWLIVE